MFREQLNYGARVWIGTMSAMVIARFDQVLMVGVVEPAALGLYVVVDPSPRSPVRLARAWPSHCSPTCAARPRRPRSARMTTSALRWTFIASGSTAALVALTAPFLLPLVLDRRSPHGDSVADPAAWTGLPDMANVVNAKLEADNRPGGHRRERRSERSRRSLRDPGRRGVRDQGAAFVTSASQALVLIFVWVSDRAGGGRRG